MTTEFKSYRYIVYFAMIVLAVVIAAKSLVLVTVTEDSISYSQSSEVTMVVGSCSYNSSDDVYIITNNVMSDITVLADSVLDGLDISGLSNGSIIVVTYDTQDKYTVVTLTGYVTADSYYNALVQDVADARMSAQTYIVLCSIALVICGVALIFIIRYDRAHGDEQQSIVAG